MKNEFILFLKRKRVLTKFKKLCNYEFDEYVDLVLSTFPANDLIYMAFDWPDILLWSKINRDWHTYLLTGKTNK